MAELVEHLIPGRQVPGVELSMSSRWKDNSMRIFRGELPGQKLPEGVIGFVAVEQASKAPVAAVEIEVTDGRHIVDVTANDASALEVGDDEVKDAIEAMITHGEYKITDRNPHDLKFGHINVPPESTLPDLDVIKHYVELAIAA